MKLKYSLFVLCYHVLLGEIRAFGSMGPMGTINMESAYECTGSDAPEGDVIKFKVNLNNINDKGDKALDVTFENKIPLDDDIHYIADFKKFENGGWKKFYNLKGKLCADFNIYIKKLWTKITGALVPKPEKSCPLPPGSYKLNKFQALSSDIDSKTIFYGKMQMKFTATDKNGKLLFCVMGEGDSQAPSGPNPMG